MRRFDTFPYAGEADILEMRLTELEDIDITHIVVEANVTHGGNKPKPYHYLDQRDRFEKWADRIIYVQASGLPNYPNAWSRESGQREWVWNGLERAGAQPDDIILHGDVDEIPTALAAQYVNPRSVTVFEMRMHPFAVDWLHPTPWAGTTAAKVKDITKMADLRSARLSTLTQVIPSAGWHFSWVGDERARLRKIGSFCHPEIQDTWTPHLEDCWASGLHVDGTPLDPVEVDDDYPRWIREGHAPSSWYRPEHPVAHPQVAPAPIYGPPGDLP